MYKILQKFNIFQIFKRCIIGEAPLSQAFWIVYVMFGMVQILIIQFIFYHYITGAYVPYNVHDHVMDMAITYAFPYLFFSSLCVWACGKNSWIEWNILSKCIVSIPVLAASFHLTNVFA